VSHKWEKIFAKHIPSKILVFIIYEKLLSWVLKAHAHYSGYVGG
jgi:hypothetical protein